ncbi:hypothetical protein CJD36_022025 [Flavipsychrobacter stenotrophus]|uniref:Uncharacterized protein n=1 Tax=Flavipsychrobacter stenotrophus TaxID=2077091 RepID=A0A2S7SQE5_9BACT|nr:T9SS type A sorting domain-containing protein [Flavipsychrobacter stenotrophus]PQJ08825.1 hypothetical protein CJD36_022025 [Flavipsychrobacter stenotrophus]
MKRIFLLTALSSFLIVLSLCSSAQVTITDSITATGVILTAHVPTVATTTASVLSADDGYTGLTNLGFTFNYYGNNYTQCVVGANGHITFNNALAGAYDPWPINSQLLGNSSALNTICAPWSDYCLPLGGSCYYMTYGAAPYRTFAVTFCRVTLYACTSNYITSTILLHETTNEIDILIGHKTSTCAWNGGYSIEGIQNATGTAATAVPGRDYPSIWSASNDAQRFSPAIGGASYTVNPIPYAPVYPATGLSVSWYDSATGAYVGSGNPITVHPVTPTNYIAIVTACADSFASGSIGGVTGSCTGTPIAGAITTTTSTACSTTTVALADTGSTIASSHQWQSSPDSLTWTNIAGAVSPTYTFSGLSANTYYRCRTTCLLGGASSETAGILISYTSSCPCVLANPGIVVSNVSHACSTLTIILADTTYSVSAATVQWQSSPDNVTWNDIAGATSATYSFTGLASTTYYRMKFLCLSGSSSMTSASIMITYTAACSCSGTPTAGSATASSTFCGLCSVTFDLVGSTLADSLGYQWQRSVDSVSWSDIPGATTVPYTATIYNTYYYRCKVTCVPTASSSFSSGVRVRFHYYITADSVSTILDTTCAGPRFYVWSNGYSGTQRIKTYYGDGQSDSMALSSSGLIAYSNVLHPYSAPGYYTIKQLLYDNNVLQDSISFVYHYYYCRTFPVKLFVDENGNCFKDASEHYNHLPTQVRVDSNGITIDTVSVTSGLYYTTTGAPGTVYSFRIVSSTWLATCPSSGVIYDTVSAGVSAYPTKYFGLTCGSGSFDLSVYAISQGAGPNRQRGNIYLTNATCTLTPATVTLNYSNLYSWNFNAVPGVSSSLPSSLNWHFTGVTGDAAAPLHMFFDVWAPSSALAPIGNIITDHIIAMPFIGDYDTTDNHVVIIDTVKGSCDPNAISVLPTQCLHPDSLALRYTIQFENIGNDTAHNVYVMDTLSDNLDPHSLNILMASAQMDVSLINDGTHNIIKFDFPGINLMDSSQHDLCGGAVIYDIKRYPGLTNGTNLYNRAGIYFDHNSVVMTNTVTTTIGCDLLNLPDTAASTEVEIYPNPATSELTIKADKLVYSTVVITNAVGQQFSLQNITANVSKVNVKSLAAGVYYVTLSGSNGNKVLRFVKY